MKYEVWGTTILGEKACVFRTDNKKKALAKVKELNDIAALIDQSKFEVITND